MGRLDFLYRMDLPHRAKSVYMLGLLLYNRRKMAEKELGVQWPRSRG